MGDERERRAIVFFKYQEQEQPLRGENKWQRSQKGVKLRSHTACPNRGQPYILLAKRVFKYNTFTAF
jgi:hypothetical protein